MSLPPPLTLDDEVLRAWPLPTPDDDADKEARGRVVIVAGSREVPGAAVLAARAALRVGAGKVLVATEVEAAMPIAIEVPETRVVALPARPGGGIDVAAAAEMLAPLIARAGAVLVGPGMTDETAASALARALCERARGGPMVLDAAAMAAVAALGGGRDERAAGGGPSGEWLVTPHAGEMAHLGAMTKEAVRDDPLAAAREAARAWHATVALKGACTVIARPDGAAWRHEGGQPGLGTAGSGDVLAGLIAGLIARGASCAQAAVWGVVLHARAGARLVRRSGRLGFLASELAAEVPALLDALEGDDAR